MSLQRVAAEAGRHPGLAVENLDRLDKQLSGRVVRPGQADYDDARRVWNGMVDKRPAALARCADEADIARTVTFAREAGLAVSVRGGGHNIAGASVCQGGLVIDLSAMKSIEVDPDRSLAWAQPGLLLCELDAATQAHGLATTMGFNSDTGIAGLTLGGGLGRLGPKLGLSCDNLAAARVVTADGEVVSASPQENPDLFWAIRGGGGNFGIVSRFDYRLWPVGPEVLGGLLLYDYGQARQVLRAQRDVVAAAGDDLDIDLVLLTTPDGAKVLALSVTWFGPMPEGEAVLAPLRVPGPLLADQVEPIAYTALQASADHLFPRGRRYYWKANFLDRLTDAAIETFVDGFADVPSPSSVAVLQRLGGAIGRVPATETAFWNRDAAYDCFPVSVWDEPGEDERHIAWARKFWSAMHPHSTGGVYVNNLGDEGEERVRAAYGGNLDRLAEVKRRYDPDNFFRQNQNIRPAA